ncbi:MAG: hydrolase [Anaerolineales bacterium]
MLRTKESALVLIDVQEKLVRTMDGREELVDNLARLIQGLLVLDVPILWMEQNPRGLGQTVQTLRQHLTNQTPITKLSFSCFGDEEFEKQFLALGRRQILLAGIEAHVCVYQTARDLLARGYEVHVIADGVSSRTAENRRIALERMQADGAHLASTEMVLFELLQRAEGPTFKEILNIVK